MNFKFFKRISGNLESKLFFLTILFLPTQLGKHFWTDFSYIYSLKIDYLSPTLYFWDLLLLGLILVWVINGAKINKTSLTLVFIFLLSQAVSLTAASNFGGGMVRLWQYAIVSMFGVYIASKNWDFLKEGVFWGLSLSVIFESLLAIYQFTFGRDLGLWLVGERDFGIATPMIATFNFYGQVFLRPYGTMSHPNVLGAFFVLSIPIIFLIKGKSYFRTLSISFGMIASLLTFSRGVIVVLFFESILMFRGKLRFFIIPALIALPFLYVRFDSVFNFDNLSLLRREELAQFAIHQFYSSPIFGIGLNNFINQIASSNLVSGPNRFLQPVHNIFLLTLAETGLFGILGFLGLFIIPLWQIIKRKSLTIYLFLAVIFLGSFDHYFLTLPQGQRLFFLIWGLTMLEWKNGSFEKSI